MIDAFLYLTLTAGMALGVWQLFDPWIRPCAAP